MAEQIRIDVKPKLSSQEYEIRIGNGLLPALADFIEVRFHSHRIVVITNENVYGYHGEKIKQILADKAPGIIVVPPGESSKSRETKEQIENQLLSKKFGRDTLIIAFGGGVIGDLAGYVAATYLRGIPVIQVPTTILSMVDSSVGGKTGVNTPFGKNLIGAFHQPAAVFCDPGFLDTLPDDEYRNGLAEALKMALILDAELFHLIQNNSEKLLNRDTELIKQVIAASVRLKAMVVDIDPHEKGMRQILNLGHTVAHAIEKDSGYSFKHGFAVAAGMVTEAKISAELGKLSKEDADLIIKTIENLELPVKYDYESDIHQRIDFMKSDKKNKSGLPYFVLLESIGKVFMQDGKFSFPVEESILANLI